MLQTVSIMKTSNEKIALFTISLAVNPYFFNNSAGVPDSPNESFTPTFLTTTGHSSLTTSHTAEPNMTMHKISSMLLKQEHSQTAQEAKFVAMALMM